MRPGIEAEKQGWHKFSTRKGYTVWYPLTSGAVEFLDLVFLDQAWGETNPMKKQDGIQMWGQENEQMAWRSTAQEAYCLQKTPVPFIHMAPKLLAPQKAGGFLKRPNWQKKKVFKKSVLVAREVALLGRTLDFQEGGWFILGLPRTTTKWKVSPDHH